jgi:hypothetical protein
MLGEFCLTQGCVRGAQMYLQSERIRPCMQSSCFCTHDCPGCTAPPNVTVHQPMEVVPAGRANSVIHSEFEGRIIRVVCVLVIESLGMQQPEFELAPNSSEGTPKRGDADGSRTYGNQSREASSQCAALSPFHCRNAV